MKRFVCHFLIVWMALLSVGTQAHAAADAAHEVGHPAIQATHSGDDLAATQQAKKVEAALASEHSECYSLSHCGHNHGNGMLATGDLRFSDAAVGAPLPTSQVWASSEQASSIERPKWAFTTPAVVNL